MAMRTVMLNSTGEERDLTAIYDKARATKEVYKALESGSKIIVNVSGGKDGVASLLHVRYEMGLDPWQILVHYQMLPEAWPNTYQYVHKLCAYLEVELWSDQASYGAFECNACGNRYTSVKLDKTTCPKCKTATGVLLRRISGVLDMVDHRKMFPDMAVRYCTDYLKTRVFNDRMRRELAVIGPTPVCVLGERWLESTNRRNLPWLRERRKFNTQKVKMVEYRPILDYRRIEAFGKLRQYGIVPHYCYEYQGLTPWQQFNEDAEGGPRCSCVMCVFATPQDVVAAYQLGDNRPIFDRAMQLEAATGHLWKPKKSLREVLKPPKPTKIIVREEGEFI